MNFRHGDVVVCIDTKPIVTGEVCEDLTWGEEYTVHGIHADKCVSLVGHVFSGTQGMDVGCNFCSSYGRKNNGSEHFHYLGWRFVKLDKTLMDDEASTALDETIALLNWAQEEIRRYEDGFRSLPDELLK